MKSTDTSRAEVKVLSGNYAAVYGAKQAQVDLISAYPITPQTEILEKMAELIAAGELKALYVPADSEHSVMSILIGASRAGARVFSSTSGQGLMYMNEVVQWAGRARIPMVMCNVCRAVHEPANMYPDHDDCMVVRDAGWLQYYCENNQEVLDTVIQGYKVAESTCLPVMPCFDGFWVSHTYEPVEIPALDLVSSYIPKDLSLRPRMDFKNPHHFGWPLVPPALTWFRHYQITEASRAVAKEADDEFRTLFGRGWGLVEPYKCEDADLILVALGSMLPTCRLVADMEREKGRKVGVLKVRLFSPFPKEEVCQVLSGARKVAIVNRGYSYGHGGQLGMEVRSAMQDSGIHALTYDFVAGAGGFDVTVKMIQEVADFCQANDPPVHKSVWMGVPA